MDLSKTKTREKKEKLGSKDRLESRLQVTLAKSSGVMPLFTTMSKQENKNPSRQAESNLCYDLACRIHTIDSSLCWCALWPLLVVRVSSRAMLPTDVATHTCSKHSAPNTSPEPEHHHHDKIASQEQTAKGTDNKKSVGTRNKTRNRTTVR